ALAHLRVLVLDMLPLQRGETAQLHVENGLRLPLGEVEAGYQVGLGGVGVWAVADGLDNRVQVRQRLEQPFKDVRAVAPPGKLERGAAADVFLPMIDEVSQGALEAEDTRLAIDEGEHLHAEGALQRRVLEQLVKHLARLRPSL